MAYRVLGYRLLKHGEGKLNFSVEDDWPITDPCPPPPPAIPGNDRPKNGGRLESLPFDIVTQILTWLDVESLRTMRHVSVRTQEFIDSSLFELHALETHAAETLQVMEGTGTLSCVSLRDLYAEFCYPWCRICGDFGSFIFLPTFKRCCHPCHYESDELEVVRISAAGGEFYAVPRQVLEKKLIVVRTFPKLYEDEESPEKKTHRLVSAQAVKRLAIEVHESLEDATAASEELQCKSRARIYGPAPGPKKRKSSIQPMPSKSGSELERKVVHQVYQHRFSNLFPCDGPPHWRFMATAAFPHWDSTFKRAENGVYCEHCSGPVRRNLDYYYPFAGPDCDTLFSGRLYNRAYRLQDLAKHCADCTVRKRTVKSWPGTYYCCLPPRHPSREHFEVIVCGESDEYGTLILRLRDNCVKVDFPL